MATQRALGPPPVRLPHSVYFPTTPEEYEAVQAQLKSILASSVFRNSKRYASVLKYIVERTIEGAGDQLKERTIGVEVFGRPPDYDTASDHAVRSAASEIRKRLAQYYQAEADSAELRIELQPGSYVPQFRWSHPERAGSSAVPVASSRATILTVGQKDLPSWMRSWTTWLGLALLTCAAALFFLNKTEEPIDRFWSPLWSSQGEFLICVGNLEGGRQADGGAGTIAPVTLRDFHQAASEVVHVNDAITLSRISALVQSKGKPYRIASQTEVTFADLQNGPSVLIGLMNNDWTGRLVQNLRYTVERPAHDVILIRDHDNPSRNDWSVNYSTPYLNINKDFALVLRVSDPKTDQMTVTVAGISAFGTLAAGEFLTNPNEIRKIEAVAPKGWKNKNLELVLSVDVIRGKPGHADIVAAHFW